MTDYGGLSVYLAGWSGPAEADPTGRAVVVLDHRLSMGEARRILGDVRPIVKQPATAAFELDHGTIAIEPDADIVLRDTSVKVERTARIFRVGGIELAPQPDCIIGLGKPAAVKRKLDDTLREVEAAFGLDEGTFDATRLESIGTNTHVFHLRRKAADGSLVSIIEPSVALKTLEMAEYVGGDAWFEVSSLQRFEGEAEAEAPRLGAYGTVVSDPDYWVKYSDLGDEIISPDPNSDSVTIAVVDGYFEIKHPAIRWAPRGLDTLAWPMQGMDAHGTACAGVAAAHEIGPDHPGGWERLPPGAEGAFPGAEILPVRVYDPAVPAHDEMAVARGIVGAVRMGASVISISLARPAQTSTVIQAAIEFADDNGRVVVAAAGNPRDGDDDYRVWYPARYPTVIAVGAAHSGNGPLERVVGGKPVGPGSESARRWSSAYGPELDVVAPGEDVVTVDLKGLAGRSNTDYWLKFAGTSAAAPVVAGVAARFLFRNPGASPADVREQLAAAAEKPDAVASPGFNVMRSVGVGRGSYLYSEQLGYGLIQRTTGLTSTS